MAAGALLGTRDPRAWELAIALGRDPDLETRKAALQSLLWSRHPEAGASELLRDRLRNDPDAGIRNLIAWHTIDLSARPEDQEADLHAALDDADGDVRSAAMESVLGKSSAEVERSIPLRDRMIGMLQHDPDREVRRRIGHYIGFIVQRVRDHDFAVPIASALVAAMRGDPDATVRHTCAEAVVTFPRIAEALREEARRSRAGRSTP